MCTESSGWDWMHIITLMLLHNNGIMLIVLVVVTNKLWSTVYIQAVLYSECLMIIHNFQMSLIYFSWNTGGDSMLFTITSRVQLDTNMNMYFPSELPSICTRYLTSAHQSHLSPALMPLTSAHQCLSHLHTNASHICTPMPLTSAHQ